MRITVIGVGLIGGSLLRALAAAGHHVVGHDADPGTRATARAVAARVPSAARWWVAESVPDAVVEADVVVLAVPLGAVPAVLDELLGIGYAGLVTDVTSVKLAVAELVEERLAKAAVGTDGEPVLADGPPVLADGSPATAPPAPPAPRFIGGHPMAGREIAGFAAADPHLFADCAWALCLEPGRTALADWLTLAALLTSIGARVVPVTAVEHDRAVAIVSHVPHLLAAALAAAGGENPLAAALGAGSFRDGTRVAASPPDRVAAMCGGNAAAVGPALDALLRCLGDARDALRAPDPIGALREWLSAGHAARSAWPVRSGDTVLVPADADHLLEIGRLGGWVREISADRTSAVVVRPLPAAAVPPATVDE